MNDPAFCKEVAYILLRQNLMVIIFSYKMILKTLLAEKLKSDYCG
ncbi:hypothetical protein BY447_4666 [Pantoea sp. JKS000250]|jgi:hypothetical protein|nr:hypothetical protein BY447_4666 [Pantoea sp. JKS000250]